MPQFHTPPLSRHLALQPLSRDHYVALVQAQQLMKAAGAADVDRRAAVATFLDVWTTQIQLHFADEERLLRPLMSGADAQRFDGEHARLRELASLAHERRRQVDPGAQWVGELGRTLNDHVRWEERELFPAIEKTATPEQLVVLQKHTDAIEASRPRACGRDDQAK